MANDDIVPNPYWLKAEEEWRRMVAILLARKPAGTQGRTSVYKQRNGCLLLTFTVPDGGFTQLNVPAGDWGTKS
jgi:hypothetical protein